MQKLAWDPVRDLTYIIGISGYTFGVVVKSDSQFKTFGDLLDWAKANPADVLRLDRNRHFAAPSDGGGDDKDRRAVPSRTL